MMGPLEVLIILLLLALCYRIAKIAERKGYSAIGFFIFAFLFLPIALIVVLVIKPTADARVPPPPGALTAGWHPDPHGRHSHRYHDGKAWTDKVADDGVQATDPVSSPPPATIR